MKTKYIKVLVSDRKPDIDQKVIGIGSGLEKETGTVSLGENGYWYSHEWESECDQPEYWLEEVPDPHDDLRESVNKLQAFKDYVHKRLDDAGIPKEPNGKHSQEGCRIGDRLDLIIAAANKDWMKAFEDDYNKRYKKP